MEQHGHLMTMTSKGIVISNKDGATIELNGDVARIFSKNVVLQGTSVALGQGAMFPTIVVDPTWMLTWSLFASAHIHATALGPSGPPTPPGPQLAPGNGLTSAVVVK